MSEKATTAAKARTAQNQPARKNSENSDAKLLADIQNALELPLPFKAEFWKLEAAITPAAKKGILGMFKKKVFLEEEMKEDEKEVRR